MRQAKQDLFSVQNSLKALRGRLAGLEDPVLTARKDHQERQVRDRIAADPRKSAAYGGAWDKIAGSLDVARRIAVPSTFLETGMAFNSQLFPVARTIVRLVEEDTKPNTERLR